MKNCPHCQLDLPDDYTFCKYCGGTLTSEPPAAAPAVSSSLCLHCGTSNEIENLYCRECGELISAHSNYKPAGVAVSEQVVPVPVTDQSSTRTEILHGNGKANVCAKCGAWNRDGVNYCETCGHPLSHFAPSPVRQKRGAAFIAAIAGAALFVALVAFWHFWGVGVTVVSNPPGARVFIDGQEVATTGVSDGRLDVAHLGRGQHTLLVKRDGYADSSQTFDLGVLDFSSTVEVRLTPNQFTLTIETDPPGCTVLLDSQERGVTSDSDGKLVVRDMAQGQHTLTIQRDGYEDWTQQVSVESTQLIRASLKPVTDYSQSSAQDSTGGTSARSQVESTLNSWAQTLRDKNLGGNVNHYADHLGTFLSLSDATKDQVSAARYKLFSRYDSVDIRLSNMNISVDSSETSATVTLDIAYDFKGKKNLNGSAQNEIWLEKRNGVWLITTEKHLQTYYENNG